MKEREIDRERNRERAKKRKREREREIGIEREISNGLKVSFLTLSIA